MLDSTGANVKRPSYAYISLFGVNSVAELKGEIVAQMRPVTEVAPAAEESSSGLIARQLTRLGGVLKKNAKDLPLISKSLGSGISDALVFWATGRNALVCFDDLERRGPNLSMNDIFGLGTYLREERGCDVLFILHDGELGESREQYSRLAEKAVDIRIQFYPTAEESFALAFELDFPFRDVLQEDCTSLSIENIRVLQRIRRVLSVIVPFLQGVTEEVARETAKVAVLLVWSYHASEGNPPPFERVRHPGEPVALDMLAMGGMASDGHDAVDPGLHRVLDLWRTYGPWTVGAVTQAVADFVERGWLDTDALRLALSEADAEFAASKARHQAFALYGGGLQSNGQDVLSAMKALVTGHAKHLVFATAGKAIRIIRVLGTEEEAEEAKQTYVRSARAPEPGARTHDAVILMGHSTSGDNALDAALLEQFVQRPNPPTLDEAFEDVARSNQTSGNGFQMLRQASSSELRSLFERTSSTVLHRGVKLCLCHDVAGRDGEPLSKKTKRVLQEIADTDPVNVLRMRDWFDHHPTLSTDSKG